MRSLQLAIKTTATAWGLRQRVSHSGKYYLIAEGEAGRPKGREKEGGKGGTGGDPREGGEAAGTRRGGGQDYQ